MYFLRISILSILPLFLFYCTPEEEIILPPQSPSNLQAETIGPTQIDLTWTDNSEDETGFVIERKSGSSDFTEIATLGKNVSSYSDTDLPEKTEFQYRLLAINDSDAQGTYSNIVTASTYGLPVLEGTVIFNITSFDASAASVVSDDGGAPVAQRGIVWDITSSPTVDLATKIDLGEGDGEFNGIIPDMEWETTYFVRSFATNAAGTSYGEEEEFTTADLAISTIEPSDIFHTTATSGGIIEGEGGTSIISRGVVIDKESNPSVEQGVIVENGVGSGEFESFLEDLSPSTEYFVRAFASSVNKTTYGDEILFKTDSSLTDADGNLYRVVEIGSQYWMAENLKTTKYNDGTPIDMIISAVDWKDLNSGAYCWYDNDQSANENIYGALYNWYTVESDKLCPQGWHVPTETEWTDLVDYLGGPSVAGGKMKQTGVEYWQDPNNDATNESGFSGLPGGNRNNNGDFGYKTTNGDWWSSTVNPDDNTKAYSRDLFCCNGEIEKEVAGVEKEFGFSVRCIAD